MGHLLADRIQSLYAAAVAGGLASQQDALLAGLPPAYVATLPHSGPPAARLLQTLHAMNAVPALADGTVPLAQWLRAAITLTGTRQEQRVFEEALREMGGATRPRVSPAPTPSTRGSLGRPARIFISYAHADEAHRKRLDVHLAPLKREGLIATWHDRMIAPGTEWAAAIDQNLADADIVLLLVSADFVASDYCFETELRLALDRHERGEARVIPILVEPTDFAGMPFAKLQGLPRDAKPVSTWANRDEAWLDVAKGIRAVVTNLGATSAAHTSARTVGGPPPAPSAPAGGVTIGGNVSGSVIVVGSGNSVNVATKPGK